MGEIKLFDLISLREDIQNPPIVKGMVGTVIHIYKPNKLFEIEFIAKNGETFASIILERNQVKKIKESELNLVEEMTLFKIRI